MVKADSQLGPDGPGGPDGISATRGGYRREGDPPPGAAEKASGGGGWAMKTGPRMAIPGEHLPLHEGMVSWME